MKLTFITIQSLTEFLVEFIRSNTGLNFEVEEKNNDGFVVTIFRH